MSPLAARTSPLSKFSPDAAAAYSTSPSSIVLDAPLTEKHFASTPLKQQNEYWSSNESASSSVFGNQSYSSDASSPIVPPQSAKAKRRRSSHGFPVGSCSPHPPSPLVGSYENSLLSGRMSEAPSKPLPYIAQIGVMSSELPQAGPSNIKGKNKAPKFGNQLSMGFDAFFYPQSGPVLPYVGNIDLEEHYFDQLSEMGESTAPRFPGYRIPAKGQIQLVIKNPNRTAVKLFLVPYDLTSLPAGSKTFLQQKSYALPTTPSTPPSRRLSSSLLESPDIFNKGSLRYAVRLQFCSPPIKKNEKQRYFLHKAIRVVFAFRSPDSHEKLRVSFDGPVLEDGWSEYDGPGEEWVSARRARARREKKIKMVDCKPDWSRWKSPVVSSDEGERKPLSVRGFDMSEVPPAPSRLGRESAEGMFARTGSPVGWSERSLVQAVSGLSISRPGSTAGSKREEERETFL